MLVKNRRVIKRPGGTWTRLNNGDAVGPIYNVLELLLLSNPISPLLNVLLEKAVDVHGGLRTTSLPHHLFHPRAQAVIEVAGFHTGGSVAILGLCSLHAVGIVPEVIPVGQHAYHVPVSIEVIGYCVARRSSACFLQNIGARPVAVSVGPLVGLPDASLREDVSDLV